MKNLLIGVLATLGGAVAVGMGYGAVVVWRWARGKGRLFR